ncbi:hypothetical protein GH714_014050 [Hevea brasiliensis]|uniref:Cation/H+ exchanger domain-containing protein n=1 Tax=Hevea brasiliensis TaxID=3981 RepID=A0A6A6MZH2_HEVBR|nr:hypothetical protein GH714_014050 [Hevea brasiliensis]
METIFPRASELLFPPVPNQVMASLLKIGYVLFTFLAAVRMDISLVKRSGTRIILLGILVFALPYTMSQTLEVKFDRNITNAQVSARMNNVNLYFNAFAGTELVDISALLVQLKITNSRLGHFALATTLVNDLARFLYNNLVVSIFNRLRYTPSVKVGVQSFVYLSIFLASTVIVAHRLILWFIRATPQGKPIKDLYTNFLIAAVLISSSVGDSVGLDYLLGPLTLGLVIPAGSPLATSLTAKLDTIVSGLLIPLLYTYCASKFNLWIFISHFNDALIFQIAFIGYAIKLIATAALIIFIKIDYRDAVTLALILNFKGPREMGTFYSYTSIETKDLDSTSGVFLIFLLSSFAPPLIKKLYDPSQRRSLSQASRSQPIIDIFNYFMVGNRKGTQVHVFTAVSPIKMMHEDICWLAFDKGCSLIILPFHKKWHNKGRLVSNNNDIRNLNINVLERAPCSVGILIDRSSGRGLSSIFSSSTVCRVCVLFIGGADDREAMAYALKMARSPRVQLKVVCCASPEDSNRDKWEDMLDSESLRSLRNEMSMNGHIYYAEQTVTTGSDTASVVRSIQESYDLIIVGRRHETKPEAMSGLSEWAEIPELGVIDSIGCNGGNFPFLSFFLKHLYFPRLTSDVLAGMILGPTFLERYFPNASKLLYPPVPNQVFASLLKIGLVLFTFLAAVRSDTSWITKIGKRGFILGVLLVGFPNLMTLDLKVIYDPKVSLTPPQISARDNNALLYLSSFTKSQFVDVSAILMQLRITNSRLGHLALASTLLGDIARFVGSNLWYLSTRIFAPVSPRIGFQSAILLIFFFMLIVFLRTLTLWFIRVTPEGEPIKDIYVHFIVVVVLYLASLGDNMGLEYLWGPFLFGLLIPARSPLATTLTSKLDTVVYGLLVPLLSGFCASKFNLWVLLDHFEDALNFQMALIGYIIKLVATYLMVLFINIPFREAAALTLILNVKGTKEMGTFLSYTTLEYIQCNAGLEILVCAHKQEDAMAAIKLLELSNPTKHSPLFIFVLCLQELVGSYTPLLINHQLGQKSSDSEASRSQPIIDVFKYFQSEHKRSALVNIFTAVSPLRQLHEDICRLAFDNNCSLILLPFHKKWNENGTLVANSNDLRKLNNDVLERAPCSVGILIDHRKTRGLSPIFDSSTVHHVAVLFIGGSDDREALAYALRMAKSPEVQLTVMCFVTPQEFVHDSWEIMLDSESLTSLKEEMSENSNISYVEETVRDGSDTAAIVSSIQGNFDLIMVGRRHTHQPEAISGLSQWAELPELGPVGDILASPDISSTCSVLVMQQQILKVDHSSILN